MFSETHAVKAKMDAFRQPWLEFCMQDVMGHMDENRLRRPDLLRDGDCLIEREVRRVLAIPQHVEHERLHPSKLLPGRWWNARNIGAVGERKECRRLDRLERIHAKAQHRKPPVEQAQRREADSEKVNRMIGVNRARHEISNERVVHILMAPKNVTENSFERLTGSRVGIDLNRRTHERVVPAHFIQSKGVIHMIMGEKDRVASLELLAQTLLTMIGRAVDENRARIAFSIHKLQRRA